ncbi:MAG: CBS domain-containing protein [Candidatus Jordarchaeum sp.]|uniref:CBS domain-containing protein n=1 Tax=Candidatus Jordarchaeum sp. TaxID=2823881 RepID=UPI00404A5CC2
MISLKVKDVYSSERYNEIVDKGTPIEDIIKIFVETPKLRGMFVVDENNKLLGVIPLSDLISWAKLMTGVLPVKDIHDLSEAIRVSLSKTAGGLVRKETKDAAVELDDSVTDALDKMIKLELTGVPVVDKRGKIVGGLQILDILKVILEKEKP